MREAFNRVKVPLFGAIGIILITFFTFAAVKPDAFTREKPAWTITGNVVADDLFFDGRIGASADCAQLLDPVCGADGKEYRNLCEAHKAGTDMRHRGEC